MLDIIIRYATSTTDAKTNTRTLLALARTSRFMLRPAQTHLYRIVILRVEQISAFTHAIDTNPALGLLVKRFEVPYQGVPSIWPLPAHVVGRLSNLEWAEFVAVFNHGPTDTSFIRLFAAPCQSLKTLFLAFFSFPIFSDLVRLVWSFPTLESLMLQQCAWGVSPMDILPDPALHPGHVSKLTTLRVS